MTNEEKVDKILDELEEEFIKVDIPIFDKLTLFAKVQNAIHFYFDSEQSNSDEDCISRAEAIKAIRNYNVTIEVGRAIGKSQLVDIVDSINKVQEKMISELPSIHPKSDALDKIRAEIDRQEKWLLQAGCTTYNVDIALDAIKAVVAEKE